MQPQRVFGVPVLALAAALAACSDPPSSTTTTPEPQCERTIGETCAGLSVATICEGAFCTADAACATIHHVQQGASGGDGSQGRPLGTLSAAASRAEAGDCIALAAGTYGPAAVGGSVSILGAGAASVTIDSDEAGGYGVRLDQGSGALLRGFSITGAGRGLLVEQASDVVIEQLRLQQTTAVALHARGATGLVVRNVEVADTRANAAAEFGIGALLVDGSTATMSGVLVEKSASAGLLAIESSLDLSASMVLDNGHFGIGLDCASETCRAGLSSTIDTVEVARNGGVGIYGRGVTVAIKDSDIGHTGLFDGSARNVELHQGAEVALSGNVVHHSAGQGVVIDAASGKIAGNEISSNAERGLWMQSVDAALSIEDNDVVDNAMVGIGATGCTAVSISGGRVAGTRDKAFVVGASSVTVADGLQILAGSTGIKVDATTLSENARVGLLIDGSSAEVTETTISGGVDALVVQNADVADQLLSDNKDSGGKPIDAVLPTSAYHISDSPLYVGVLPIPLP